MKIKGFILALCMFLYATHAVYNETLAGKLGDLCSVAYCPEWSVYDWTCAPCGIWKDAKLVSVVSEPKYSVFGFMATIDEGAVFVFEGTQDLEDILIDLQFGTTIPYKDHPTARVHEGFWKAYLSVRDYIIWLLTEFNETPLYCTGHSLGGAMATLLAIDLQETMNRSCIMYNMGSPRVGNRDFGALFMNGSVNHRITHWSDPVPHLPPLLLDFYHIQDEIWYNEEWSEYVYCPEAEDKRCSDSKKIATSVRDHRVYFNKSITACKDSSPTLYSPSHYGL